MGESKLTKETSSRKLQSFLEKVAKTPIRHSGAKPGRLIFSLDATASREPTWDRACQIQGEMFKETALLGGLEIQLAYYRGFGEFCASPWTKNSESLLRQMTGVFCLAGESQFRKVLSHTVNETKKEPVDALVFVGDCIEEDVDALGKVAGELGILGVPVFIFQEGFDSIAEFAFQQTAKLSGGAYCRLDAFSALTLKKLLRAVAVYAAGGHHALNSLANKEGGAVLQIAHQIKGS